MKVELFGLGVSVEINENELFSYTLDGTNDVYEECAISSDGRLVAYDETIGEWVQLTGNAEDVIR